ncbi:epoxide hydrolase family protein [Gordonia sp. OPL2]|uniref:epoxide hydrolase family protein n=1 Tax=Gordonia sp. OPL2 TaxID=2486274 RepID=UPI001CA4283D|nr:epoxide hydrolase [Gordonia sp. OPL2]
MTRFEPRTDAAVIDDLRRRLRATRWPDMTDDAGWGLGVDVDYLRELVDYWIDDFDWQASEDSICALPHRRIIIRGLGIHVIHRTAVPGARPAVPLLLNHGWPDSSWRYLKVLPLLADPGTHGGDPDDAFDVIVPDMPGFGHSERPTRLIDSRDVAGLWGELMTELGYERFLTAGGDMGSHVSRFLALDHPDRVVAVHRMDAGLPRYTGDPADLTDDERAWLRTGANWARAEGGYAAMHSTKPQTAAVGLTDSPAGLAAWIVEKLRSWSDCGGDIESAFTKDDILALVTQYWVTETIGSSMRMYRANAMIPPEQYTRRVEVPSGFSLFGGDVLRPPRAWLERTANVVSVTEPARGGHFAPYEQPESYAEELRTFFRPFRSHFR